MMRRPTHRRLAAIALVAALAGHAPPSRAEAPAGYRTPPPVVAGVLTAPRVPRGAPSVSPDFTT